MHRNAQTLTKLLIESVKAIGEAKAEFLEEAQKARVGFKSKKIFSNLNFPEIGNFLGDGWRTPIGL